jgi:hypothetical protein
MPYTVTVHDGSREVHVYQVGQTVGWVGRHGSVGVVTKVVVDKDGPANMVRWPGNIQSTHRPGELRLASEEGSR